MGGVAAQRRSLHEYGELAGAGCGLDFDSAEEPDETARDIHGNATTRTDVVQPVASAGTCDSFGRLYLVEAAVIHHEEDDRNYCSGCGGARETRGCLLHDAAL